MIHQPLTFTAPQKYILSTSSMIYLLCYFFSAGFMTWEITHNIESLLVKDGRKTRVGFDFTVDVNADSSHDLAECVKGTY